EQGVLGVRAVEAVPAARAPGRAQQPLALVEAQHRGRDLRALRQRADGEEAFSRHAAKKPQNARAGKVRLTRVRRDDEADRAAGRKRTGEFPSPVTRSYVTAPGPG